MLKVEILKAIEGVTKYHNVWTTKRSFKEQGADQKVPNEQV